MVAGLRLVRLGGTRGGGRGESVHAGGVLHGERYVRVYLGRFRSECVCVFN